MNEINRLLVEKYPNYTIYIDLCPKNFERPSFLIELISSNQRPINSKTMQVTSYFTITCYDTTDDYSHSDTINLLTVQQEVIDIFSIGYIKVGDRAIGVSASFGGRDFDKAYVDLQFEYYDDRMTEIDELMKIKEVYVTVKEE